MVRIDRVIPNSFMKFPIAVLCVSLTHSFADPQLSSIASSLVGCPSFWSSTWCLIFDSISFNSCLLGEKPPRWSTCVASITWFGFPFLNTAGYLIHC